MSWSEDPFVSSADDSDSDDPFAEPEFPGPGSPADSEPSDPFADTNDGIGGRDPFVRDPFDSGPGGDTGREPFDSNPGRDAVGDPFGTDPSGYRDASSGAGPKEAAKQFYRDRKSRIEATPFARRRQRNRAATAGRTQWSWRWPWLVGVVLVLAMLVAGTLVYSWRDDGGPRIAQSAPDADSRDDAQSTGTLAPAADSQSSAAAGPEGSSPTSTPVSATDSPATGTAAEGGESKATAPRGCDDHSGIDPHGLISFGPGLDRLSFCGEETWQVFVCTVRDSDQTDRVTYIDEVLGEAAAWFDWASGGQYDIDFSAGDDTSVASGRSAGYEECFEQVLATPWSETRSGAVVLLDEAAIDPF